MTKKNMISEKNYYTPPSDVVFNDIKQGAIKIWKSYSDEFGYQSEKVDAIKDLKNISDNYAYMVAMFDPGNQTKLLGLVKRKDTKKLLIKLITW